VEDAIKPRASTTSFDTAGLRHHGRRARPQALGRRKAAGGARTLLKSDRDFRQQTTSASIRIERAIQSELRTAAQNKTW
jgi:hypothetical protein